MARLDADGLERLGQRAEALTRMRSGITDGAMVQTLHARLRGLAAVFEATGENLVTLERADGGDVAGASRMGQGQGYGGYGSGGRSGRGLFESLGLYDNKDAGTSIWPRGGDVVRAIEGRRV